MTINFNCSMDENFSSEAILSFLRQNLLLVGASLLGLVLLGFGFFMMQPQSNNEEQVMYEAAEEKDSGQAMPAGRQARMTGKQEGIIFVDIAGAVVRPGVYEVSSDARVQDVLTQAGGLAENADKQGIAKTVNLAAKLTDGMKLYFPFIGESASVMGAASSIGSEGLGESGKLGGVINLNSASQSELESLPGVGAVTAGKIIKGRPYASVEELKSKKVVGNAVYEKIKDEVTVN